MSKIKKFLNIEFMFRHIISNAVIAIIVLAVVMASLFEKNRGVIQTSNSEYNGTIYAGDRSTNKVSLMINVYWGTEFLVEMLEIFKQNNIKTTFFIGGTWAEENRELLKQMQSDGHEIASHGYSHKEQGKYGYKENFEEINKCHLIVKDILGIDMNLFAPPGGSYNAHTIKVATSLGYKTIMWTRDTIDWRDKNEDLIFSRATANMQGGDLILMHPTSHTVKALSKIINFTKSNNFQITTVSDVIWLKC